MIQCPGNALWQSFPDLASATAALHANKYLHEFTVSSLLPDESADASTNATLCQSYQPGSSTEPGLLLSRTSIMPLRHSAHVNTKQQLGQGTYAKILTTGLS